MKQILISALVAFMSVGCATQPSPGFGGENSSTKENVLSGNEVTAFGVSFDSLLRVGGTTIVAKDGGSVNYIPKRSNK